MPSQQSQQIRATLFNDSESLHVPLEIQRQEWEAGAAQTPLPPNTTIEPLVAHGVACERVSCSSVDRDKLMLYLHGGGFNAGSCKTHRELAARLSLAAGIPVLLVDYRLAPEHPFPAAIEDATSVYRWLIRQGARPDRMIVSGDSSGGGLALSTLLALRDSGQPLPAAAVMLSPWVDLAMTGQSLVSRAQIDPLVSRAGLQAAAGYYIGDRDPKDPLISPLYADLRGLPPLLIHVGDHEILLSDSLGLTERARAAGVDVRLDVWPDMWHVWHAFAAQLPEGQEALDQLGAYMRQKIRS